MLLAFACAASAVSADAPSPLYSDVPATIAFENDRVLVQRYVIQPGRATGRRTHDAHELLIYVRGGVLTSNATRRASLWPDGRVVWLDEPGSDAGSTNTGSTPVDIYRVLLKPRAPHSIPGPKASWGYLNYPNVPGEDVLENDWMIVQRFRLKPGEWEGVHAHNPNTFYIFINDGRWLSKSRSHPSGEAGSAVRGTIAWMDAIDLGEQHQSGNTGTTESDVIWVALKQ